MNNYSELLLRDEWRTKRLEIFNRDKFTCKNCNNSKIIDNSKSVTLKGHINEESNICFEYSNKITTHFNIPDDIKQLIGNKKFAIQLIIKQLKPIVVTEIIGFSLYNPIIDELSKIQADWEFLNSILNDKSFSVNNFYPSFPCLINKIGIQNFTKLIEDKSKGYILLNKIKVEWIYLFGLQVHHTYYQEGKMPWEYEEPSLITYCKLCHAEVHEKTEIPFLSSSGIKLENIKQCNTCHGTGFRPEYSYYKDGICFDCDGIGYLKGIIL